MHSQKQTINHIYVQRSKPVEQKAGIFRL